MELLLADLRHALRALRRRPGFTAVALLTLALGIGANAAVFTLVDALLLAPLPFGEHSARVVSLHSTHATLAPDARDAGLSFDDLADVRQASTALEDVAGYLARGFTLSVDGEAERVEGGAVTPNLFPLIGAEPRLGRQFLPEEGATAGFEPVVLLSHGLWQRRFGGDPAIVGRTIHLNQRALVVVGVMGEGFRFPERAELWVPYGRDEGARGRRFVAAIAVMRAGVTLHRLQHELDAAAAALAYRHPETNRGWGLRARAFRDVALDRGGRVAVLSLMGAVGFVLLIGCANLANLMLARGVSRQREVAVRTAVGASRGRVVRLMLMESLVLSLAGTVLGGLVGTAGIEAVVASWPEELPYWIRLAVSGRVVAFLGGLAVLTAVAFGLLPALRVSRTDVIGTLKEEARSVGSRADRRLQTALVVGQVALCLALLVGANLMVRSFLALQTAHAGFEESGVVSLRVSIAGDVYDPLAAKTAFFRRVAERLRALPGVVNAAATSAIPADDGGDPVRVVADGRPVDAGQETGAHRITIQPALFETLGLPVEEGRTFTERETEDAAAAVAIVNRTLAERLWPGLDAVGRRVGVVEAGGTTWLTVVGVAPEIQYEEFGEETGPSRHHVYVPYARSGSRWMALLVRASGPADALVQPVRRALAEAAPDVPVFDLHTMRSRRLLTTWPQRFLGRAMAAFAAVALFLACLGVYGVLSHAVSRRTREIGVRMALGATREDVARLVLGQAARMAAAGVAGGLLLAAALARALQAVLYGVSASDPWALLGMAALLAAVVLAASGLPSRAASRTDPLRALRHE